MRLPLATDLSSRDGSISKDAVMKNCFLDGEMVTKRPAVNSDLIDVAGVGQGGLGHNSLVYMINGDVLRSYNASYVLQDTEVL